VNHPYDLTYKYVFILDTFVDISDDDNFDESMTVDQQGIKIGKLNYEK
jgi:hypothetical protein